MSMGRVGYKTKLAYGDGATPTENFTEIAEQTSLEPADAVTDEVEFSNQDSLNFRKEWKPTWIDGGELTCTANYIPGNATQEAPRTDRDNQTIRNWRINVRDPITGSIDQTITFAGYVKGYKLNTISPADKVEVQITIRVTGAETWT
jgi:Lambda phage tail tube protein, TTP